MKANMKAGNNRTGQYIGTRLGKAVDNGKHGGEGHRSEGKTPLPIPSQSRRVSYAKPKRTVKLLDDVPTYLPSCPSWVKLQSLWSPRLSPRHVDVATLGWGRHGSQVLHVWQRSYGNNTVVMKQFAREKLLTSPHLHDKVLNEWRIHSALVPHPNIVPLYGAVEDKSYVTLIMEAQSGDMLWFLDQMNRETISEDEARAVAGDVLSALAHMHEMGYVHRDVKAENIFAAPPSQSALIPRTAAAAASAGRSGGGGGSDCWRLGDLGSAVNLEAVMQPGAPGLHLEGSPPFLAPEYAALWLAPPASRTAQKLQRATSPKQDIWAFGAFLYDMLVGHPPFSGPSVSAEPPLPQLVEAIVTRSLPPLSAEAGLSAAAADFITAALRKAPEERPTAAELLTHPWLTEEAPRAAPAELPSGHPDARRTGGSVSVSYPPPSLIPSGHKSGSALMRGVQPRAQPPSSPPPPLRSAASVRTARHKDKVLALPPSTARTNSEPRLSAAAPAAIEATMVGAESAEPAVTVMAVAAAEVAAVAAPLTLSTVSGMESTGAKAKRSPQQLNLRKSTADRNAAVERKEATQADAPAAVAEPAAAFSLETEAEVKSLTAIGITAVADTALRVTAKETEAAVAEPTVAKAGHMVAALMSRGEEEEGHQADVLLESPTTAAMAVMAAVQRRRRGRPPGRAAKAATRGRSASPAAVAETAASAPVAAGSGTMAAAAVEAVEATL